MTPEFEEEIVGKHPTFFRSEFSFECGDGWHELIDKLLDTIAGLNPPDDFVIYQIKEKFGGLRVYTSVASSTIYTAIEAAEEESYRTCENCGDPGKPRDGNWINTLCDGCAVQKGLG